MLTSCSPRNSAHRVPGSYSCRVGFATHEAGDAERAELEEAEEAELRLAVPEGPGGSRRWSAVLEETG